MNGECILIIDDSKEIVKHLAERILPPQGYQTRHAYDGKTGLKLIQELEPDLIMLDFNLPEMTGLDVLQALANESINIPVILMTGYGSELSAIEAFRLGAKDYLIKPFTTEEILDTIDRALGEQRLQNDIEELAEKLRLAKLETSRQSQEMQTLFQIGKAITSLTSVDKVLQRVLDAALYLTHAQASMIWLPDSAGQFFTVHNHLSNDAPHQEKSIKQMAINDAQAGQVMVSGKPLRQTGFSLKGILLAPDLFVRAVAHVPLKLRGITMGVLSVANLTSMTAFSKREEFLLSFLADYAAIALENARVFQAADQALASGLAELDTLIEITRVITSSLNLDEIIRLTVQQVQNSWHIEAVSLWLLDENRQYLRVYANVGTPSKPLNTLEVPIGTGFVGYVAETGRWLYTNDAANHPLHNRAIDTSTGFKTRSLLSVPLNFRKEVLGVMQLLNKQNGDFDDRDVEQALSIASAVAVAVTNARLFEIAANNRKIQDEFIATVSHDLRAPLTSIIGFSEMLEQVGALNSMQHACVEQIVLSSGRMLTLVTSLLELAKINATQIDLNAETFELCLILHELADEFSTRAPVFKITLQLDGECPCLITGNKTMLHSAISNLIENAIKYSGETPSIEIRMVDEDTQLIISVRDWGVGIPDDELPRIFDQFYRGSAGKLQSGSGLGLALVKSISLVHGGEVWAESKVGEGSTFFIRLPRTPSSGLTATE